MATKTTNTSNSVSVGSLLKILIGLLLWTALLTAGAFWISPVLGTIVAFFAAFVWTFYIAPRLAGQMVAALIVRSREKKANG